VLHTTEGLRTFDYPWPPHFTLGLVGDPHSLQPGLHWFPGGSRRLALGDVLKLQHCDLALSSYALLHRDIDPDTNHRGSHCVQVEIISTAAAPPHWSQAMYDLVGGWLADVVTGLPDLLPVLDNYPDPAMWSERGSWGFDAPQRMTWAEWENGINGRPGVPFLCAHQHVPGNDHWDTGALDVVRLVMAAKAFLNPSVPDESEPTFRQVVRARLRRLEERMDAMEAFHASPVGP